MAIKLTQEEFISNSRRAHGNKYDYSKAVYTNSNTKVIIICPVHGEFEQRPVNHMQGYGCKPCGIIKCGRRLRLKLSTFIKKSRAKHGNKYNYDKVQFETSKDYVIIICPTHGEFEQNVNTHMQGKGCQKCAKDRIKTSLGAFIKRSKSKHGDKYNYDKVQFNILTDKVIIICPDHGEFEQVAAYHISGHGCKKCATAILIKQNTMTTDEFICNAILSHGTRYNYEKVKYINSYTNVTIICYTHGEFEQVAGNHLNGAGCTQCCYDDKRLTLEEFICRAVLKHGDKYKYDKVIYKSYNSKILIGCPHHGYFKQTPGKHLQYGCAKCGRNNISEELCRTYFEYYLQDKMPNVRPKFMQKLELDGYSKKWKVAFEYQGKQHYERVKHWQKTEQDFINQQKRDQRKKELCKKHGITLLEIDGRKYSCNNKTKLRKHIVELLNKNFNAYYDDETSPSEIIDDYE